jgi:hypothetical protein
MSSILASIDRYISLGSSTWLALLVLGITVLLGALRNVGKTAPTVKSASPSREDNIEEFDINKDREDGGTFVVNCSMVNDSVSVSLAYVCSSETCINSLAA